MPIQDYIDTARHYDLFLESALTALRKAIVVSCSALANPTILEIACGTGSQAAYFAKAGLNYRGIDLSEHMLEVAAGKGVNCFQADGTALPFDENGFDAVTISLALHEMPPEIREGIATEMARVVKPDGAIIVGDYSIPPRNNLISRFNYGVMFAIERLVGGDHYRNYRAFMRSGGVVSWLEAEGLPIDRVTWLYGGAMAVVTARKQARAQ